MKNLILGLFLLLYPLISFSQNYLVLFNGNKIETNESILYQDKVFSKGFFIINDHPFAYKDVHFIGINDTLLGSSYPLTYKHLFFPAYRKDSLNYYGYIKLNAEPKVSQFLYMNKGYNNFVNINYKNLSHFYKDDPKSIQHLEKYKKYRNIQTSLFLTGLGVITAGSIYQVNLNSMNTNVLMGSLYAGSALIYTSISFFIFKPKLKKTILIYHDEIPKIVH